MSGKMKAAVYYKYGTPEVLSVKEFPVPVPDDNELLIKVYASTVNRTDTGFRSACYFISRFWSGLLRPKINIPGCEFAGEVVETGKNVKKYKSGDRVFGYDDIKFTANAEYIIQNENDTLAIIPDNLSYEEAAPLTEGAHYALCDLRAAKIKKGDKILIYGATGAIGSAAVQLSKYFGTEVTAVCDTKNIELVKSLGSDEVIDYTTEDYAKADKKFIFIFDAVGKSSFNKCRPIMEKNGIYISTELGYMGQNIYYALITPLFRGKRVLFPLPVTRQEDIEFIRDIAEKGLFKPVVDRKYKLEEIVEAHRYVESGKKTGNVLLIP